MKLFRYDGLANRVEFLFSVLGALVAAIAVVLLLSLAISMIAADTTNGQLQQAPALLIFSFIVAAFVGALVVLFLGVLLPVHI